MSAALESVLQLRFAEIDSTNSEALRRAASLPDRALLLSERQTAGRGRRGRAWQAPGRANVCMSLFARVALPRSALSGLTVAMGVAAAEALRAAGVPDVLLKWPNDLLARQRKLGGLLVELTAGTPTHSELVIGIGLNLLLPRDSEVGQPWIDLAELLGAVPAREDWEARLGAALLAGLDEFVASGLSAVLPRWAALDALAGREVRVEGGLRGGGRVLGLASDGALRLRDGEGEWLCHAGEVSVRAA